MIGGGAPHLQKHNLLTLSFISIWQGQGYIFEKECILLSSGQWQIVARYQQFFDFVEHCSIQDIARYYAHF